ncbi:hypothetical protein N7490_000661 [Penicillium lividum]|nr:hypothetical protein N7490_000661 [Penicillium lividum]
MKFYTLIITVTALFASAEACQCLPGEGVNKASTFNCCRQAGVSLSVVRHMVTVQTAVAPRVVIASSSLQAMHNAEGRRPPPDNEVDALLDKCAD